MIELRENARYIFWSGALAFHGPKIIFLHDKNKEFLVEKSSFILCTCYGLCTWFMYMLWWSEIWKN